LGQDTIHGQAFAKLAMNVVSPTQYRKCLTLLSYYIKEYKEIANRRELQGKHKQNCKIHHTINLKIQLSIKNS